jgi:hypothetical protein
MPDSLILMESMSILDSVKARSQYYNFWVAADNAKVIKKTEI